MVVGGGADVTRRVRCPCDAVHAGAVIVQPSDRRAWYADIEYNHLITMVVSHSGRNQRNGWAHLHAVHGERGQVVRVLLVPRQAE